MSDGRTNTPPGPLLTVGSEHHSDTQHSLGHWVVGDLPRLVPSMG